MLLHQADKLLIGPMTSKIMDDFGITMTQMGAVSTGALIVGAILLSALGIFIRPLFSHQTACPGFLSVGARPPC